LSVFGRLSWFLASRLTVWRTIWSEWTRLGTRTAPWALCDFLP
jgi:hypothetical protein